MKYTRQEAIALNLPTCYGSLCKKHPEADGLRRVSGACVICAKESVQKRRAANVEKYKAQMEKSHKKEWEKIWFLNVIENIIVGEIEYNVLTDKTSVIESTDEFINIYNQELNLLKNQLNEKTRIKTNY